MYFVRNVMPDRIRMPAVCQSSLEGVESKIQGPKGISLYQTCLLNPNTRRHDRAFEDDVAIAVSAVKSTRSVSPHLRCGDSMRKLGLFKPFEQAVL